MIIGRTTCRTCSIGWRNACKNLAGGKFSRPLKRSHRINTRADASRFAMDVVNTGLLTASLRSDEMLITARGQFAVGLTSDWILEKSIGRG